MSECEHKEFEASVNVNRLEDTKPDWARPVTVRLDGVTVNRLEDVGQFAADIHIQCRDCGMQFRFLGMRSGLHPEFPTVSVDGTEARLPIAPLETIDLQLDGVRLARALMPHIEREA